MLALDRSIKYLSGSLASILPPIGRWFFRSQMITLAFISELPVEPSGASCRLPASAGEEQVDAII